MPKESTSEDALGRVISLINMKGGVGKTTLAVGLAWELAMDHKVLLVDIDPQFNATQWLVPTDDYFAWLKDKSKRTAFDVFQPDSSPGGISGFRGRSKKSPASLSNAVIHVSHASTQSNQTAAVHRSDVRLSAVNWSSFPRQVRTSLGEKLSR